MSTKSKLGRLETVAFTLFMLPRVLLPLLPLMVAAGVLFAIAISFIPNGWYNLTH